MKKLIILMAFMASLATVNGQFSFSVPVGYSTRSTPIIGANAQLQIGPVIFASGFDSHMSRKVNDGDLFWGRMGIGVNLSELNKLEITTGIGSYRKSADIKNLNEGVMLFNVQYVHQMESRPNGAIFAGITTTPKFSFVSGGLRFTFKRQERDGCPSTWVR